MNQAEGSEHSSVARILAGRHCGGLLAKSDARSFARASIGLAIEYRAVAARLGGIAGTITHLRAVDRSLAASPDVRAASEHDEQRSGGQESKGPAVVHRWRDLTTLVRDLCLEAAQRARGG